MRKTRRCSECHQSEMVLKPTFVEFKEGGIHVKVSGMKGWVCPKCGTTTFPPGVMNEVLKAANALFEAARSANLKKARIKECVVARI